LFSIGKYCFSIGNYCLILGNIVKVLSGIAKYHQISQSIISYCHELPHLNKKNQYTIYNFKTLKSIKIRILSFHFHTQSDRDSNGAMTLSINILSITLLSIIVKILINNNNTIIKSILSMNRCVFYNYVIITNCGCIWLWHLDTSISPTSLA
jgi:hypothetical protein